MIRLTALSGSRMGQEFVAVKFPIALGRESEAAWRFEDPGIWARHAVIQRLGPEGFWVEACSEALVVLNGAAVERAKLRSGDILEMGAVRLRFDLAETRQRSFRLREALTWAGVALLCLGQVFLVYWVLP